MSLRLAGPYFRENGACPYLPGRDWAANYLLSLGNIEVEPTDDVALRSNTFVTPSARLEAAFRAAPASMHALEVFGRLLAAGFRRAGQTFYRPTCDGCSECVSLRVDVAAFTTTRDQRRALRKNPDVSVEIGMPSYSDEKFEMYRTFLQQRYKDDDLTVPGYENFFLSHLGNTREFRYRTGERLVGLGFVDLARDAASSVYFFFDPSESPRSLGTYSALREIDFCRQSGRRWLYMGYRVAACRAMAYKSKYRPHELLDLERGWVREEAFEGTR